MEFKFNSKEEELALTADDKQIYSLLATDSYPLFSRPAHKETPIRLCSGLKYTRILHNEQPGMLPITSDDLQMFINNLESESAAHRYWSFCWIDGREERTDWIHEDKFRRVAVLGNLELSFRPLQQSGPKRLHIHTADAHEIAVIAQNVVMSANADVSIAAVMGEGFAIHPGEKMKKMERRKRPQVAFEWKITPAPNDLAERVKVWRIKACGGKNNFYIREREYYMFLQKYELQNPSEDPRTHIPASSGEQSASHGQPGPGPQQAIYQQGKRPSWEMGGQEFSPSLKRRSTGSQTWGSSSQSSLSSPEVSRPPSVADPRQTIMGPPRLGSSDRPMRQTWSWRGSRGSIGSRTARVTSGMAGLTVQSPSWGSPEGVAPPSEGSPWGAPQAMAGSTFGQPGGGYGHYSQDYVRPSPAYGQPTEVYGHPGQDLQGPPVRPFQVGIAHTQIPGGEWPPPQPWRQQQLLVEQGHLQHSQQPGQRAGFGQWPHGSGYNLPRPGPDVQTGGNYAPSFPPAQPVMHGGGDRSLQQPHHMAVGPPMRRIHQSSLQNMPMTESPQLQGLAAASIPSSFPPNPPSPMTQSLPPPSVSGIDPAQFQAVTTCPPVGHSYPSSRPPTTRSTPAELIDPPEPEDLSADSESYSESESDSEDGQDPYQATQPSQPFLDDGRFYQSPEPAQQSRSGYEDPYWGANDSAEE